MTKFMNNSTLKLRDEYLESKMEYDAATIITSAFGSTLAKKDAKFIAAFNPQQVLELLSRIEELEKALKAARETLIYAESPLNSMGSLDKTVYWFRTKSMEWLSKYSHLLEKKESEK